MPRATKTAKLTGAILFTFAAWGQPATSERLDRVFHFNHADTALGYQEIANLIGTIAEIPHVSVDNASKTLTLNSTAAQIAMADWLFSELDKAARKQPVTQAANEYRPVGSGDDIVSVFYLQHTETPQATQEIINAVRVIPEIARAFQCTTTKAVAIRGTVEQTALAEWLVSRLDRPAGVQPEATQDQSAKYERPIWPRHPGGPDVIRVFYAAHTDTQQRLQDLTNAIRTIGNMARVFQCAGIKAIIARDSEYRVALAEWLFHELDKPAGVQSGAPRRDEFSAPDNGDGAVRVYYLAHAGTAEALQKIATKIRTTAGVLRIYSCGATGALALRGTVRQLAAADSLIQEMDRPEVR